MPRKVALAIGISRAPRLEYLRGAVNGAHEFADWAAKNGYQSESLTDETTPVTIESLGGKLDALLAAHPQDPVTRLVLYFAGHGLIRGAEDGLWLLSDWRVKLRAVAFEALKRRLCRYYGVPQVAIFSDACRSLPSNVDIMDLTGDAVLGSGPDKKVLQPDVDKFIATQDAAQTFMVPGLDAKDDRCLFSGVLMEGLWGAQAALSATDPGKVTSSSLADFLRDEVPERAKSYNRELYPTVQSNFRRGSDVYFGDHQPPPVAPVFTPWTDPNLIVDMGVADSISKGTSFQFPDWSDGTPSNLAARPGGSIDFIFKSLGGKEHVAAPVHDSGDSLRTRIESHEVPGYFETGSGFAVDGKGVRAIWLDPRLQVRKQNGKSGWLAVGGGNPVWLQGPSPVLIELEGGNYLAQTAFPDFIASALCDGNGVQALIYRESYGDKSTGGLAIEAIARMESGALRAADIPDLSIELRMMKHADPVLGVISAYLYDSIEDVDSIRRMAWFYIDHHQAIPYDIALLAQVPGRRNENGLLEIDLPAVPPREPRSEKEAATSWACQPTPSARGTVAGFWPWMKQGWPFLDDPLDVELGLVHPALPSLQQHLTGARFTTFNREGGETLATIMNLQRTSLE